MPTIVIDHDGTYSLAPEVWKKCIDILRAVGFDVICITSRFPDCPLPPLPFPVYYACGELKWEFAHRNGLAVDIWIDDSPCQIGEHPKKRGEGWPQREIRSQLTNQIIDQIARQMKAA